MKLIQSASLIFMLLAPVPGLAQEFHDEWYQCKSDNQCVIVKGYCNFDWAINKNYLGAVNDAVSNWAACAKTGTHNPNAIAKCHNNKCTVVFTENSQ